MNKSRPQSTALGHAAASASASQRRAVATRKAKDTPTAPLGEPTTMWGYQGHQFPPRPRKPSGQPSTDRIRHAFQIPHIYSASDVAAPPLPCFSSVQFSSPSYSAEAFKTAPLHPHAPARVHPPAYAPATYGGFSVPHLMSPPPVHPAMYPPHLAGHVLGEDPYASMVRLAFRPVRRKPPSRPTTVLPGRWIARGTAESPGEHAHHHHRL